LPKRVLLDECLPRHLKRSLAGHEVCTVPEAGWASKENGELLALAVDKYDVFVTVDRNLTFQQNLEKLQIAIVVLVARGNRLEDLMPLVPALQRAVETIERGQIVRLGV
jgi:hypothetical protein